jgi:glycerophosphoryl diester phosphodiesterase
MASVDEWYRSFALKMLMKHATALDGMISRLAFSSFHAQNLDRRAKRIGFHADAAIGLMARFNR